MLEYAIVGLIVAAAAFYAARKFMPFAWRKKLSCRVGGTDSRFGRMLNPDSGRDSGCDTCKACADPAPAPPGDKRVITIHKR